jgi:very-short-patch-repair endonuclease
VADADPDVLADDAEERLRYFEAGGSRGFIFKPKIVKRTDYLREVTVDGVSCSKLPALRQLVGFFKAERQLKKAAACWAAVSKRWSQLLERFDRGDTDHLLSTVGEHVLRCNDSLRQIESGASKVSSDVAETAGLASDVTAWAIAIRTELSERQRHEADMQKWTKWRDDVSGKLGALQDERKSVSAQMEARLEDAVTRLRAGIPVVDDSPVIEAAHEVELLEVALEELKERVADQEEVHMAPRRRRKAEIEGDLTSIKARKESTRQSALQASHAPDPHPLCRAIVGAVDEGNANAYADALARLQQLDLHRPAFGKLAQLLGDLAGIAPKAAAHIAALSSEDNIGTTLGAFRAAWDWARANTWVTEFRSRGLPTVDAALAQVEKEVNDAVAQKAALLAWRHCREAATQKQQESLREWEKAVKKVGKGKYADRYRRQAMQHMRVAQGMIPVLVSPLPRLVESLTMRQSMFDVVIVDEASQLGPEGTLLFYIGEQVVVVGDDEQISPEEEGLNRTQVQALVHRYLRDVAGKNSLEYGSLFDQADVRFGGRIRLREHFRCVPEIIAFSNQLCYRDDTNKPMLVPLRMVTGNRLHPPLKTVYVPTGFKTDVGLNEAEADAVVNAIVDCHNDPSYERKTFGVVSLLGKPQAEHIYRRLVEALGTDSLNEREIVCGDAYSFQGDERDVMFASMVVANNATFQALTAKPYRQRFNVAASRARDQMWLFHSVALNDLKPDDLRYKLLEHCTAVEEQRAYLLDDELAKCDSDFEREVARRIWASGYRVRCQHRVAHYRIDLVVEGSNGNHLAVECDGDRYHPPEQYDADVQRQRVLERCGWRFWRVWGSDFAADPEESLQSLWRTLTDLNIGKSA